MEGSGFRTLSSFESERVGLLKQRRKAYVLIFMMIMLAQTSYIGAMQGWTLPDATDSYNSTAVSYTHLTLPTNVAV